jgi:hypothetical protein
MPGASRLPPRFPVGTKYVVESGGPFASATTRKHRPIPVFEMMERLGIEPSSSVAPRLSLTYATAISRCEVCPYQENCRYWLAHAPASINSAPKFCPDAEILFELQFDQLRPSPAMTSKSFA